MGAGAASRSDRSRRRHGKLALVASVRRALALSFLQNYSTTLIQFVASLFVARLLSPAEFGIFSVSMVLVAIVQVLRDFGVADYIAQERDLTIDKIRAAAALAMITGFGLAALLLVVAWPAALYFGEPGVGRVLTVLAMSFMLIPFGTVTMAWVRRNLEFDKILVVRVVTALVGSSTSVVLAYLGFSYMSMAWGLLAGSVVTILLSLRYRPRDWPWRPSFRHLREVFNFGTWSTGVGIASQVNNGVQDLILGRGLSMEAVGFYGRAGALLEIVYRVFANAVYTVASPYFAHKERAGGNPADGFCLTVRYLTVLIWPSLGGVCILAPELITLLYGDQWLPSVDLARILAIGSMMFVPYLLWSSFYVGLGRVRAACIVLVFSVGVRGVILIAALPWGLKGVVVALSFTSLVNVVIYQISLRRQFGIGFGMVARAFSPSVGISLPTLIVALAVAQVCRAYALPGFLVIVLTGIAGALVWLALVHVLRHPLAQDLRQLALRGRAGENGG